MRSLGRVATLVLICTVALVGVAAAGEYHSGSTLYCADCHIMHGQQQHGYNANGTGQFTAIGSSAPYHFLLRNEINDLCLTRHDGVGWAPDVLETGTGSTIRQAGALNRAGTAPYYTATGHTLDATDIAPGGTWSSPDPNGLNCIDCHHQHGYAGPGAGDPNGTYRNLQYAPGDQYGFGTPALVTYAIGTQDLNKDVFIDTAASAGNIYDISGIFFNEPDPLAADPFVEGSAMARNCAGCHADFFEDEGVTQEFHLHPSAEANIGALGGGHSSLAVYAGHTNKVKVMSESGDWSGATADVTPTCISCHKAHGNQNAFGLIYMKGTGTVDEEGDDGGAGVLEDLCGQCHVQVH